MSETTFTNPALWAETFADDEDFYEAGCQPGDEVQLFASDEAGQLAKARLSLLELAATKEATLTYSVTPPSSNASDPAPRENSPTTEERADALQFQNFLRLAASDPIVVGECWPDRNRLFKKDSLLSERLPRLSLRPEHSCFSSG